MTGLKKGRTASAEKKNKGNMRQLYNAEEKIRIVLEGPRVEESIAEFCRKKELDLWMSKIVK